MRLVIIAKNIIYGKCTVATRATPAKSKVQKKKRLKLSMVSV